MSTIQEMKQQLLITTEQMLLGIETLSALPQPIVTIFGGARLKSTSEYVQQAQELARCLVENNISVITGGGPGIMEGANCGARLDLQEKLQARSIGITVKGLVQEGEVINKCVNEPLVVDEFYARKWLMLHFAIGFAVFPGGFGTIDELGEVITLTQTKKLSGAPIVLINAHYWKPFLDWIQDTAFKEGVVSQDDIDLIQIADSVDEAVHRLQAHCFSCK